MKRLVDWIGKDGMLHIGVSLLITIAIDVLSTSWWVGTIFALILGIGKELMDIPKHSCEWHDIICDIAGIALGIGGYFIYFSIVFGL